jgi:hypothetical protein
MIKKWRQNMKRITLTYLATYLFLGGVGLLFVPDFTLKIFQSNGSYGDIIPRFVGILMVALSGLIAQFVYYKDYKYYPYSVYARSFIVISLFFLYYQTKDPFFLIINGIVLLGLLPSVYILIRDRTTGEAK